MEIAPLDGLFADAAQALTPEGFLHVFPQRFDSEGFLIARLRKTGSLPPPPGYKLRKLPFTTLNKKMAAVYLQWSSNLMLWQRDKEI